MYLLASGPMDFWTHPLVGTTLALGVLLGAGQLVQRWLALVPASIVAGSLGLLVGPSVLGWLPLDASVLETGVYHALGIVFICVALQPRSDGPQGEAASMALGISVMVTMQTVVGLAAALALGVHAGFGLLLPLGFEQGPGQALSLGTAWEASGMPQGGQVGLILAAIGFGWAVLAGVPLVHLGGRLGFGRDASLDPPSGPQPIVAGALSRVFAVVAVLYSLTWLICDALAGLLAGAPDIAAMVWGFHFLVGAILASGCRAALDRLGLHHALDGAALTQLSGTTVDVATVAALSAVKIAVLSAWWLPILVVTTAGGLATLALSVVLSRFGFREDRFEHAVLWYGMSTGTLPVGLALLRVIDPDLRSAAPASAVYGSALAILGVAPVVLLLHPLAITGEPTRALAFSTVWMLVLLGLWAARVRWQGAVDAR